MDAVLSAEQLQPCEAVITIPPSFNGEMKKTNIVTPDSLIFTTYMKVSLCSLKLYCII